MAATISLLVLKSGSVIGGRGARPCDVCGKERARWYCAADDAYLCERCDGSVHCANALAGRHERVRLGPNGAPVKIDRRLRTKKKKKKKKSVSLICKKEENFQSWHHGSRKRSQITYSRSFGYGMNQALLIPKSSMFEAPSSLESAQIDVKLELTSPTNKIQSWDLNVLKTEDTELAQEVPIFEPLLPDLISACHGDLMEQILTTGIEITSNYPVESPFSSVTHLREVEDDTNSTIEEGSISIDDVSGIDGIDVMDLCTSSNLETESSDFNISDLNMWSDEGCAVAKNPFKAKGETQLGPGSIHLEQEQEIPPSPPTSGVLLAEEGREKISQREAFSKTISLRLNYEDVLSAWSDRGSLWMDGQRPQIVPIDSSFLEIGFVSEQVGQVPVLDPSSVGAAAREARVLRYKEKRRTRLFSKKIRYEVRKLNAERRPRMKGRFVKRADGLEMAHLERGLQPLSRSKALQC